MNTKKRVIVVGAGIAGLTAAWKLRQNGFAVTVLEADALPGGRIKSIAFHGHQIEVGAQFLSTGYRYVPSLFQEMGLSSRVRALSTHAALQRGKRLHRVHPHRPWTLLTSGMLGWGEFLRLAVGTATVGWRNPSCFAEFCAIDDVDAEAWCRDALGPAATRYVIESMVHGLYFHRLSGTSRALIAAMLAFGGRDNLAVAGGWQALPKALAAQLDLHYGTQVDRLEATPERVRVWADGACWTADAAVLAVPAHVARGILVAPSRIEERVLSVEYAATVHIAFGMSPTWRVPDSLLGVYGCLLSPSESERMAALTFESGRGLGRGEGDVVSIMLGHDAVSGVLGQSDDAIAHDMLGELETLLPRVTGSVTHSHVQRWASAEPLSPVGRAAAVAEYRASLAPTRNVVLAGDYLGTPWTDGAAETGVWAAQHVVTAAASATALR